MKNRLNLRASMMVLVTIFFYSCQQYEDSPLPLQSPENKHYISVDMVETLANNISSILLINQEREQNR